MSGAGISLTPPADLLNAINDGAEYRFRFASRGPWTGTAHRDDEGRVTLRWHGATGAQDRTFRLELVDDRIVVPTKANWGELLEATPRTDPRSSAPRRRPTARRSKPYEPHPNRERILESAVALARFAATCSELVEAHRREALSVAIWKATEADGKYRTRYRSAEARRLRGQDRRLLRHESALGRNSLTR